MAAAVTIEEWMIANRSRAKITKLKRQLENAQRRGFKKTSIDLETFAMLLNERKENQ